MESQPEWLNPNGKISPRFLRMERGTDDSSFLQLKNCRHCLTYLGCQVLFSQTDTEYQSRFQTLKSSKYCLNVHHHRTSMFSRWNLYSMRQILLLHHRSLLLYSHLSENYCTKKYIRSNARHNNGYGGGITKKLLNNAKVTTGRIYLFAVDDAWKTWRGYAHGRLHHHAYICHIACV